MARPRTNDTVSLFPFLAVLVCAMGALILLLLVTTRRIRSNAVAHEKASRISERFVEPHDAPSPVQIPDAPLAKSFPPPMPPAQFVPRGMSPRLTQASPSIVARIPAPSPPPIDPDKRWNVQLATLTREHEVEKAQVDGAMAQLSNFLGQAKQLRQSIAEAEQRLQALQSRRQETVTASASTSATAEELQEKIDHATRRLQQLRKQAVTQSTQYTFVAFDGAHGTTRRPILIECSKAGYRFAQEDIGLDEKDFYGFTSEYNPLMAGARALIEYWQIQAGLDQDAPTRGGFRPPSSDKQDKHSAPYVLLIVRPDGAPAYYAARKMLAGLRTTFGYELFEADRDLHAPASDPKATAQCRQAIQEMMRMRRELRQQVLGGQPGSGDPQIRGGQLGNGDQPSGGGQPGRDVVQRLPGGSSLDRDSDPSATGTDSKIGFGTADGAVVENRAPNLVGSNGPETEPGNGIRRLDPESTSDARDIAIRGGSTDPSNREGTNPPAFNELRKPSTTGGGTSSADEPPGGLTQMSPDSNRDPSRTQPQSGSPNDTGSPPNSPDRLSAMDRITGKSSSETFGQDTSPFPSFEKPSRTENAPKANAFRRNYGQRRRGSIGIERSIHIRVFEDRIEFDKKLRMSLAGDLSKEELIEQVLGAIDRIANGWPDPPDKFYWVPSAEFVLSPGAHGNRVFEVLGEPLRQSGMPSRAVLAK